MGVELHDSSDLAKKRLDVIRHEADIVSRKSRTKKKMKKKGASEEEIQEALDKIEEDFKIDEKSSEIKVPYLFHHFKIRVTVYPPSRRRFDPPNLYPTVKHLIDGLTDASWWGDDQFSQLLEVSFRYGGITGETSMFQLTFDIDEIDESELSEYVLTPDKISD